MPTVKELVKPLKGYRFLGVEFNHEEGQDQAIGDCPFCGREGKWYCSAITSQWDCKSCGEKGNLAGFLRLLWKKSDEKNVLSELVHELRTNRGLLYPETMDQWEVVRSSIANEWLIPGHGPDGKLNTLYKWGPVWDKQVGKRVVKLQPTAGTNHQLFGNACYNPKKPTLYITEGPWDGMIWYETLRYTKLVDGLYAQTASESSSLYHEASVLSVPSCAFFSEHWATVAAGKDVILLYDSDHNRAGYLGMKKVSEVLASASEQPNSIRYLCWGKDGFDPNRKPGWDLRDHLSQGKTPGERVKLLGELLGKVQPIPEDWIKGRSRASIKGGHTELETMTCTEWKPLINSWRKAMKWSPSGEGLDHALAVMLASALSTETMGDQLWVRIVSPPASGKSTLCEALSTAKKYVKAVSTIRGFHSGFQTDRDGVEDNSLLAQLQNKTLVLKDGDTLLQSPNLDQILSEARDVYDRVSRTSYRNKASRDYEGINMTWILCGTSSLRQLDTSELGQRFLDCVIMDGVDDELERDINHRVVHRTIRNMGVLANGTAETRDDADLVQAKRLTGGYVEHLRKNADTLLSSITISDEAADRCIDLGTFVAYLRARPSKRQSESVEREFSTRLVIQHTRLAGCLAVVLNKKEVDAEVLERVKRVALDTARGRTLEIARHLYQEGDAGCEVKALEIWTGEGQDALRRLLKFLRRIRVAEPFTVKEGKGLSARPRWRLTQRVRELYKRVLESWAF